MPRLTLPFNPDEIRLPVMLGVDGPTTRGLIASGQPVPRPVIASAVIDTGSNVTAIQPQVLRQLGLVVGRPARSTTAGGVQAVALFEVSVGLLPIGGLTTPVILSDRLTVIELAHPIPGTDVLVGLDLLLGCQLHIDGPNLQFTLSWP
jgi:predicted aspartyl protease